MIVSIDWLKDHIEFNSSLDDLEKELTALGLECSIKKEPITFSNVIIGKILSTKKIKDSDHLNLCLVEGLDSGIIDPLTMSIESAMKINKKDHSVVLALDLLNGKDEFAMNYISNYRSGKLQF